MVDWTEKKVRLLYDDLGKVLSKIGEIQSVDDKFIEIHTTRGTEIIPLDHVVRMEVLENGQ